MTQLKIAILPGSTRRESCNAKLGHAILDELTSRDVAATFISLADFPLPIYDGDLEAADGIPQNVFRLAEIICQHHGVVLVSPEYNSSISPLLKNALDWLSRDLQNHKPYQNKVFALASCSPGALGGIRGLMHLRDSLLNSGVEIITPQLCVGSSAKSFADDGSLIDARHNKLLDTLCTTLVKHANYCLDGAK